MEKDMEPLLRDYLNKIKQIHPIVHCITNTITVNDCANPGSGPRGIADHGTSYTGSRRDYSRNECTRL